MINIYFEHLIRSCSCFDHLRRVSFIHSMEYHANLPINAINKAKARGGKKGMSCQLLENEKVHIIQGSYSVFFLDDPLHCKRSIWNVLDWPKYYGIIILQHLQELSVLVFACWWGGILKLTRNLRTSSFFSFSLGCLPAVVKNSGISYVVYVPPHTINFGDRDMKRGKNWEKSAKFVSSAGSYIWLLKEK